jgi:iron complex outermembrane recepter protein
MNNLALNLARPRGPNSAPALILIVTALAPCAAPAQEARADAAAAESTGPEEVIVTARRRDESLASVPIAITAIGADQLVQRSIRTDADLQLSAPGLTIRQTQGNNSLTYSIRGQSADTFSGSPSAVIAYLNEVPLTIGSASSFYDLESVQVLKGPQGTLFGRNTTGGAVLYTTARPTDKTEALLRARLGNLELLEVEGMINVPFSDTVMLRGAFDVIERDGYIENLLNGDDMGQLRRKSGRLTLTVKPTESVENTTFVQYTDVGGTNTGASYTYSVYQPGDTNNGFQLASGSGFLFSPALDFAFGAGAWNAYLAAHPDAFAAGLPAYLDEQQRIGPYKTRHPGGAKHEGRDLNASNTTTFEVSDRLTIKNILGASSSKTDSEQPQLGAPFVTILTANVNTGKSGNELEVESISDELQLQGEAFGGDLSYIAGYYFQSMQSDTLWPQTYFDVSPVLTPVTATNNFRIRNETNAVYTQGTYDLGSLIENLSFTAGLRYTWEHVSIEQLREGDAFALFGSAKQSKTFEDPSWEAGFEYQATPSVFTYLKTRGSFRSGGFNGSADPVNATATGGGNLFDSETTQDVEAGLKFRGDAFGRPATLSIAVFKQWIEDVQRVEFPDPDGPGGRASIAVTANVPKEEVEGVELEASILATSWLELGISGALTDAEFTENEVTLFGTNYAYGPVGDTPKRSGVAFVQIGVPAGGGAGELSLRAEVYAQTEQYFSNAAASIAPGTELPGYELINARLNWSDIFGSKFSAALFGKNLSDETYFVGGMTLASALGHNAAAVGEPRTYGLEMSYRY